MSLQPRILRRTTSAFHVVLCTCAALIAVVTCVMGVFASMLDDLPVLDPVLLKYEQSVKIEDRNGKELYRIHGDEDRTVLSDDAISQYFKDAVVAIEDERFYDRTLCIDFIGIARSFFANLEEGKKIQGGSTITQQLVRSVYLSPEKTYTRKIREIVLACRMEREYSRDEILTFYMNRVSFGGTVYGAERASQAYFGIPAHDLSLSQAAVLAAIPQRPSVYTNPARVQTVVDHDVMNALRQGEITLDDLTDEDIISGLTGRYASTPEGRVFIDGRAESVLTAMRKNGYIDEMQEGRARAELRGVELKRPVQYITAPHFVEAVRADVRDFLSELHDADAWMRAGMHVRTTLDANLQNIAEDTVRDSAEILKRANARHAAMVVIDRKTREVLAYVGNVDYFNPDAGAVDMASSPRQTGSAFKPVVYTADMATTGANSGSFILDAPLPLLGSPKNYDGGFRGWMSIRNALGSSRNIPAIRAFYAAGGEENILNMAANMGVTAPTVFKQQQQEMNPRFSYGWPMAIGAAEIPLVELTQAYATIADAGMYAPLRTVDRIEDDAGGVLLQIPQGEPWQAVDARAAREVDEILRDPLARPKGFWRDMLTVPGIASGVKTGTSNLCLRRGARDKCLSYGINNVWAVGYDDRVAVGVWVGNADNAPLTSTADGLTVAAPIWRAFLERYRAAR